MFILRYTDEEVIASVKNYMEKYPNANRYTIITNALSSEDRIRKLEKEGKVTLPKAIPRGNAWRKFNYAR